MAGTRTTETIVQYRQMIDGVPVISPDAGTPRVAVDNDGNATRVEGLAPRRRASQHGRSAMRCRHLQPEGMCGVSPCGGRLSSAAAPQRTRRRWRRRPGTKLRAVVARLGGLAGRLHCGTRIDPGRLRFTGDTAELIATRTIEVDFGSGYRKLYRIECCCSDDTYG